MKDYNDNSRCKTTTDQPAMPSWMIKIATAAVVMVAVAGLTATAEDVAIRGYQSIRELIALGGVVGLLVLVLCAIAWLAMPDR
jgi:hypothetical protein